MCMPDEDVASVYDQIATQYSSANAAMPEALAAEAQRFLQLTGPRALVLDVGCGTGRDVKWLTARGAIAVGCDISHGMLRQAGSRSGTPGIRLDMRRLGLPSGQFQGIWCCASLLHLPKDEAPQALTEMRRVLASGGVLFLSVQEGTGESNERCSYADVERWFARYTPDEVAALLRRCGFVILEQSCNVSGHRHWLQYLARAE